MAVALQVEVLLFARLRELAGASSLAVSVAPPGRDGGPVTARDVWDAAGAAHPRLAGSYAGLRVAVNQAYASWDAPVRAGDTVAFIPPVAGGSGSGSGSGPGEPGVHVWLTAEPLDARVVEQLVRTDEDGAVCTFTGVVRNHADGKAVTHLEYEAYHGMAEERMRAIAADALVRFGATAVAAVHRIGTLGIGEASVVVAASAHHRAAAFEACRYTIDTLKADAPIWKKEHGPDGAVWVDETGRQH
jgi:molybdopterin synthase catalytic subunit